MCDMEGDRNNTSDTYKSNLIKLYACNIPNTMDENDIQNVLSQYCEVEQVVVIRDPVSYKHKHCAFIYVPSKEDVQVLKSQVHKRLVLDGMVLPVKIRLANEKKRYKDKYESNIQENELLASDQGQHRKKKHLSASECINDMSQPIETENSDEIEDDMILSKHHFSADHHYKQSTIQSNGYQESSSFPRYQSDQFGMPILIETCNKSNSSVLQNTEIKNSSHPFSYYNSSSTVETNITPNQISANQITNTIAMSSSSVPIMPILYPYSPFPITLPLTTGIPNSMYSPFSYSTEESPSYTVVSDVYGYHAEGPHGANLFVYHLPSNFTEMELNSLFSPFGRVISAIIYRDRITNLSRGFGFVSYSTIQEADHAISSLNGYHINGKVLKVQKKKEKKRF